MASLHASMRFRSESELETKRLGQRLGRALTDGALILLEGDLGCGKTVFVKGLAAGLDVPDRVVITSPTYTLINEYPARLPFYHADLYRLKDDIDLEELGLLDLITNANVVAVEWGGRLAEEWPARTVRFQFDIINDSARQIAVTPASEQAKAIVERLQSI